MRNLKKVLAVVLAVSMIMGTAIFANAFTDVADTSSNYEAISVLASLDILKGYEDGSFKPDQTITRAEFAAVTIRSLGLEGSANGAKGKTPFEDVTEDWMTGYINMAYQSGIILGDGNGKFRPNDPVSFEEAVKMIVASLGYTPKADTLGGYPSGYLVVAAQEKITVGVSGNAGQPASRGVVARMVFNALEVPIMEQMKFGTEIVYEPGNTMLLDKLQITKVEGSITGMAFINETNSGRGGYEDDEVDFTVSKMFDIISGKLKSLVPSDTDFSVDENQSKISVGKTNAKDYIGYILVAYIADIDEDNATIKVAVPKSGRNEVFNLKSWDVNMTDTTVDGTLTAGKDIVAMYDDSDKTQQYKFTSLNNIVVYENKSIKLTGADALTRLYDILEGSYDKTYSDYADLTFLSTNTAGKNGIDVIYITTYKDYVVDEIYASSFKVGTKSANTVLLDYEDEDKLIKFFKDGKEATFADMKKGDVISVSGNKTADNDNDYDFAEVFILSNKVTGTVEELDTDEREVKIGGKVYGYSEDSLAPKLSPGNSVSLYVNYRGFVFENDSLGSVNKYRLAYITIMGKTSGIDGSWSAKVLTVDDNKWNNYNFADKLTFVNAANDDSANNTVNVDTTASTFDFTGIANGPKPDLMANDATDSNYQYYDFAKIQLDSNNKISRICFNSDSDVDSVFRAKENLSGTYNKNAELFCRVSVTSDTKVVTIRTGTFDPTAATPVFPSTSDISVKTLGVLVDGQNYSNCKALDINDEDNATVVFGYGLDDSTSGDKPFIVVEKKSKVASDSNSDVFKFSGYAGGAAVSVQTDEDTLFESYDILDGATGGSTPVTATISDTGIIPGTVILSNEMTGVTSKISKLFSAANAINGNVLDNPYSASYPTVDSLTLFNINTPDEDFEFVFGYVLKKNNSKLTLLDVFSDDTTVQADESIVFPYKSDLKVVEYNAFKGSTPTIKLADAGTIEIDPEGNGSFVFARVKNGTAIDVLTITPKK